MDQLILKRGPVGQNQEHYSVLENGVIVGRIFLVSNGPPNKLWMWASGDDIRRAVYGYEPTREAAMASFAKNWRPSSAPGEPPHRE